MLRKQESRKRHFSIQFWSCQKKVPVSFWSGVVSRKILSWWIEKLSGRIKKIIWADRMNEGTCLFLLWMYRRWTVICLNWDKIAELILNDPICLLLIQHLSLLRLGFDLPESTSPHHHLTLNPSLASNSVTVILWNCLTFLLKFIEHYQKGFKSCPVFKSFGNWDNSNIRFILILTIQSKIYFRCQMDVW